MTQRKKRIPGVDVFSADLYRELGELKQEFKDHCVQHDRDHEEREARQRTLDGRLDSIDKKLEEATEIKRGMAILLKIATAIATVVGLILGFLKIKQTIHN